MEEVDAVLMAGDELSVDVLVMQDLTIFVQATSRQSEVHLSKCHTCTCVLTMLEC